MRYGIFGEKKRKIVKGDKVYSVIHFKMECWYCGNKYNIKNNEKKNCPRCNKKQ